MKALTVHNAEAATRRRMQGEHGSWRLQGQLKKKEDARLFEASEVARKDKKKQDAQERLPFHMHRVFFLVLILVLAGKEASGARRRGGAVCHVDVMWPRRGVPLWCTTRGMPCGWVLILCAL